MDLESVVRTTAAEPYTEKRIFQIGAVRMGTDTAWSADEPTFDRFVQLPDDTWEIRSDEVRARHQLRAVSPSEALLALHAFCTGADMIVTYNGTEADFPLLADAYQRAGLPDAGRITCRRVLPSDGPLADRRHAPACDTGGGSSESTEKDSAGTTRLTTAYCCSDCSIMPATF